MYQTGIARALSDQLAFTLSSQEWFLSKGCRDSALFFSQAIAFILIPPTEWIKQISLVVLPGQI